METRDSTAKLEKAQTDLVPDKNTKKLTNDRFKWWQSILILMLTLAVSVATAYYVSDKYLWTKFDINRLNQQLEYYKDKVDAQPNEPRHRVDLGYTYFLKNDHDNAIKQLKIALDLDKNFYDAYLNLGIVYNDQERYNDALNMSQKVTEIAPKDYKGHLLKGSVFRKMKRYEDANEALSQANVLMPGNTDIIYEIGKLAEDQGDKKNAQEIYKEALNYDPLYKPALEGLERVATNDSDKK